MHCGTSGELSGSYYEGILIIHFVHFLWDLLTKIKLLANNFLWVKSNKNGMWRVKWGRHWTKHQLNLNWGWVFSCVVWGASSVPGDLSVCPASVTNTSEEEPILQDSVERHSKVVVLVGRGELRATSSTPTLGERNVWGTYPKLLYSGKKKHGRERNTQQQVEEREDHVMLCNRFFFTYLEMNSAGETNSTAIRPRENEVPTRCVCVALLFILY